MKHLTDFKSGAFLLVAALMLAGCGGKHSSNNFIFMPDMAFTPAIKYQSVGMKPPVEGTFPRGYHPLSADMDMDKAGKTMKNPLKRTEAVLARGQQLYNTYCATCHGPLGLGDGGVVPRFPRPPSLQSDKIREFPDGNIYYIISRGQNLMSSYASQIAQDDRWAIVHYIRAIQKAYQPSADDLKAAGAE